MTGAAAIAAARWDGIDWQGIAGSGLFGLRVFAGKFGGCIGLPARFAVRYSTARRRPNTPSVQ